MAGLLDVTYKQLHALGLLLRDYGEADACIGRLGEDLDVDVFDDNDQLVCHAVVTRAGVVRTAPVIGLGRNHNLGGEAA